MRWYSEMLLNKPEDLSEKQLERVTSIHTATVHLAELVDDLLNLSRIERGSLEPEWNESDLKGLIQEVESELEQPMAEKQHRVTHEFDEQLNAFFMDARLIRQVVMNLLSNAVKYTPQKGVIEVRLQVKGEEVVVEVADTGIGIAQGQQDRIFEKFFRTKEVVESGIGGTGLGLSVAKMMVEQCGGRMWFTSQEGKGSTFGFSLPYLREKPEA
jgi:signal transduction histidine kinase